MSGEQEGCSGAERFRADHQLGLQPLADLVALAERTCGVDVAILDGGDDAHGMTLRHGVTTIIGIARTRQPMRQRSTIAHELAHVYFDDLKKAGPNHRWAKRSLEEVRADAFARHLLVPTAAVTTRSTGRAVTKQLLSDLVQMFGASPHMVAIQMREADLISDKQRQKWAAISTSALATRLGWASQYRAMQAESDALRPPQHLLARATQAYTEGVLSAAAIARLNTSLDVDQTRHNLAAAGIWPPAEVDAPAAEVEARLVT